MRKFTLLTLSALLLASCASQPENPAEKRARELISKMTIEEKASLMMNSSAPVEALGIPSYNWWNEALHGVARNGKATVFPMPIGMAASFDEPLVNEVFTAVSDEARVKERQAYQAGHLGQYQGVTFWTPNINIFRDPRWGRGMETYGEDPYLTGILGMAVVRGLQGPSDAPVLKAHACAKHYAVHSGPEPSRHTFNAEVSERDLRETYLPAFKDLVTKADVQEVMIAYNRFRGEPCGASDYLLNTILRGEWGYKGLVVSDCHAISDFFEPGCHGYSEDGPHAVAAAIHAGTDLNCGNAYRFVPDAVRQGLLDEADVDRSLTRLLSARIRLGELDGNIAPWEGLSDDIVEGKEHLALSRKMALETFVLLQNRGNILPLKADTRIALVGPNADDREMMWGNYNGIPDGTITLADGLKARFPDLKVIRGCELVGTEKFDVPAVLKQLKGIETVVFAGGISPRLEGEEMDVPLPGFNGGDRTSIELPQVQRDLIAALHKAGKKVILVNFSGSALGLVPETENCEAILQVWYPGQEGGAAITEMLLGEAVPSGKLPLTFYKGVDQLPDFEDYSMHNRTYRYFQGEPLFPFGFGLSYTTFSYGEAAVKDGNLVVPVTNTGSVDAQEVAQLYVRLKSYAEGPLKSLRGFSRVNVPAGKTVEVAFPLTDEVFLSWNALQKDMVPTAGEWELLYGGSSADLRKLDYTKK
ncbi:MAG: glycoside hydrolase family 3 C-terminal domain-containing protein [Bacteroidales bacterium]|nr:glycoside hydrolase family 3 C-terminal domain-containing protein [Bacteroidales bacterium]